MVDQAEEAVWGLGAVHGEIPAASAGMTERGRGVMERGRGYDGAGGAGMTERGHGVMERGRGCDGAEARCDGARGHGGRGGRGRALGAVVEGGVGEGVGLGVLGARDVADRERWDGFAERFELGVERLQGGVFDFVAALDLAHDQLAVEA